MKLKTKDLMLHNLYDDHQGDHNLVPNHLYVFFKTAFLFSDLNLALSVYLRSATFPQNLSF